MIRKIRPMSPDEHIALCSTLFEGLIVNFSRCWKAVGGEDPSGLADDDPRLDDLREVALRGAADLLACFNDVINQVTIVEDDRPMPGLYL